VEPGAGTSPSETWATVGAERGVGLLAIQLWLLELPFLRPLATARGTHSRRPLVLVQVIGDHSGTLVEGWGECAALADTTFDAENATRSLALLQHALVPGLTDLAPVVGSPLPAPSDLGPIRSAAPDAPLAYAALEMAVADTHLRAAGVSLAARLGRQGSLVPIGTVVGRPGTVDDLVTQVGGIVDAGYARVKVKIGPGWDVTPLGALRAEFPRLVLQADANGSYGREDIDHLTALDPLELLCLEQPLEPSDLEGHTRLGERLRTPICLDESLSSARSVHQAVAMGACSAVCVKPGRLGGIGAALDVIGWCAETGIPAWIGGMFESGFARGVNTVLAALPGVAWPGDLSPASGYLGTDLVPEPQLVMEPLGTGDPVLWARPPDDAGMGPTPDPAMLERSVQRRVWIELPRR
jgi:O-succinylbenzoate synthase